jgi:hypothetical protein
MSTEQHGKLHTFLNTVGNDDDLVHKWWQHGAHAFEGDNKVGQLWAELGDTNRALLVEGDLCKIQQALYDEGMAMGETAHLPSWALVRI